MTDPYPSTYSTSKRTSVPALWTIVIANLAFFVLVYISFWNTYHGFRRGELIEAQIRNDLRNITALESERLSAVIGMAYQEAGARQEYLRVSGQLDLLSLEVDEYGKSALGDRDFSTLRASRKALKSLDDEALYLTRIGEHARARQLVMSDGHAEAQKDFRDRVRANQTRLDSYKESLSATFNRRVTRLAALSGAILLLMGVAWVVMIQMLRNQLVRARTADSALRESEERFRRLADVAPVMLWVAGVDKGSTYFNLPWLQFRGRTMDEELGKGWAEGVHSDDLERCMNTYATSFDARKNFSMVYRLRRADGEFRWILDNGAARYGKDGAFVGYIGSCIDVSDLVDKISSQTHANTDPQSPAPTHLQVRINE